MRGLVRDRKQAGRGKCLVVGGLLLLCCAGCLPTPPVSLPEREGPAMLEQPVQLIPLDGALRHPEIEISGLAWYGDRLVFLPQHPGRRAAGRLFALTKEELNAHLEGRAEGALLPQEIPFVLADVDERVPGFDGFEAIVFRGDRAYLSIEAKHASGMHGYLVAAEVAPALSQIRLDPQTLTEIPVPVDILNMSYEALLLVEDRLIALFEANGANVNPTPQARVFDLALRPLGAIPFPAVEYRLTDATAPDACGRFWGINYLFPGEYRRLDPAPDVQASGHEAGAVHLGSGAVERLLAFAYRGSEIVRMDREPIWLQPAADGIPRNWEGVARLDDRGFLIVTDRFPTTMLAFIRAPEELFDAGEDACE